MNGKYSVVTPLKNEAKTLRQFLVEQGCDLGHGKCLEAIAKIRGYKNWDTASAVLRRIPLAVIMTRVGSHGDPWSFDLMDFIEMSTLQAEDTVAGDCDATEVHSALRDGKKVPPVLANRLLAICYTDGEHTKAWKQLITAFEQLNPRRRAAWRDIEHRHWRNIHPARPFKGVIMTPNEWHGLPVEQESCFFARSFRNENGEVNGTPEAVEVHRALNKGELPENLAFRLLALCYSSDDCNEAFEQLSVAHETLYSMRQKSLRKLAKAKRKY